jgi:Fic-DOC domain mobile mystery protein B
MGLDFRYSTGQTPLDEDETDGLRLKNIATRGELDEVEQHNIEKAMLWLKTKKLKEDDLLSEKFIKDLHHHMYSDVWKWAGQFRKSNKNIGVDKHAISLKLKQLLDDSRYWILNQSFPVEEIAIRFKHRVVQVHCFANGNGRHSRLIADTMMEKLFKLPPFTWNANLLSAQADLRSTYIKALQKADAGDYKFLLHFAKS